MDADEAGKWLGKGDDEVPSREARTRTAQSPLACQPCGHLKNLYYNIVLHKWELNVTVNDANDERGLRGARHCLLSETMTSSSVIHLRLRSASPQPLSVTLACQVATIRHCLSL